MPQLAVDLSYLTRKRIYIEIHKFPSFRFGLGKPALVGLLFSAQEQANRPNLLLQK